MGAAPAPLRAREEGPRRITLLDLVRAIGEITHDEGEIVATAVQILRSGRVRLCGNFRGTPPEDFS